MSAFVLTAHFPIWYLPNGGGGVCQVGGVLADPIGREKMRKGKRPAPGLGEQNPFVPPLVLARRTLSIRLAYSVRLVLEYSTERYEWRQRETAPWKLPNVLAGA